ncbi:hypothetical protein V5799_021946, partial [Amblyomma americanum]
MTTIRIVLLSFVLRSYVAAEEAKCSSKYFDKSLGINPDAWKVIDTQSPKYHLMFYSKGLLQDEFK